ncbi:MAG: hypothetical protein OEY49_16855, partial [Candidatus Heimdallarchaeota archaeon]|nr:hypothetical protein [Candidatus Heimdallarchaeota archaeon]
YRRVKLIDLMYQVYLRKIADVISDKEKFAEVISEFLSEIKKIPLNRTRKKPLIGIVGEIYLRFNSFGNGDLVRQLESLGAEVHLAPFTELIFYGTNTLKALGDSLFGNISDKINHYLVKRLDNQVFELFKDSLTRPDFGQGRDADMIVKYGRQYVGNHCAGEGPLTLGAIEEYCRHGADGVIMIGPMGCLPNITFKGLFEQVRDFLPDHLKDMPRMEITVSESLNFKNILTRIEPFVNQANDYMRNKEDIVISTQF